MNRTARIRRILVILTLCMAFLPAILLNQTSLVLAEITDPIAITATWTDTTGEQKVLTAGRVEFDGYANTFWLYLMEGVPENAVLSIIDQTGQFTNGIVPAQVELQLSGYTNAGKTVGGSAVPVMFQATAADGTVTIFNLYISNEAQTPETPPAAVPQSAVVSVHFVDESSQSIYSSYEQDCATGQQTTITAQAIDGYTPNVQEQTVTVGVDGVPDKKDVTFIYTKNVIAVPQSAVVSVRFVDESGQSIYSSYEHDCATGQQTTITAQAIDGYTPNVQEQTVTVGVDGVPDMTDVTFIYTKNATAAPQSAKVRVNFLDESGQSIYPAYEHECTTGQATLIKAPPLEGYTLAVSEQEVVVDANGNPSPAEVIFSYSTVVSGPVNITIYYVDENKQSVASSSQYGCQDGTNTITAAPADLQPGYTLVDPNQSVQYVTVKNNQADPTEIFFYYKKADAEPVTSEKPAPKAAIIKVYYRDQFGKNIIDPPDTMTCVEGESNVVKVDQNRVNGKIYELADASEKQVQVDSNGVATPNEVIFLFKDLSVGRVATVMVRHLDEEGKEVAPEQKTVINVGETTFSALNPLPENCELLSSPTQIVTLAEDGTLSSDTVVFNYKLKKATEAPTASPTPIPEEIADGMPINRWAASNEVSVNVRSKTNKNSKVITTLQKDSKVWVYQQQTEGSEKWYAVMVNGREGFVMTKFIDLLSKQESDAIQSSLPSPAPLRTLPPVTSAEETPTPQPATAVPVTDAPATATPAPVVTQAATATPAPYQGFALTTKRVALRSGISNKDEYILETLPEKTLLYLWGQAFVEGETWNSVEVPSSGKSGYVPDHAVRRINSEEAKYYQEQMKKTNEPPVSTPIAQQFTGYAITLGNNVPMRNFSDTNAQIVGLIAIDQIVQVLGQEYHGSEMWQVVRIADQYGFIRADQLRMLSADETQRYLNSLKTPVPSPEATPIKQVSLDSPSSYGYVNSDKVRLRKEPSSKSSYLKVMNKNAFALVLGSTTDSAGKVWHRINQAGTEGYVAAEYFNVLPLNQLSTYLQSAAYLNANSGKVQTNSQGKVNTNITPMEDYNKEVWQNPKLAKASYEPFNPLGSPTPDVESVVTPSPSPSPSESPEATTSLEPLTTDVPEKTSSSFPSALIGLLMLGILGAGGYYAYYMYRQNRMRASAREAKRRQQQAQQSGQPQTRPAQSGPANTSATSAYQPPRPSAPAGTRPPQGTPGSFTPPPGGNPAAYPPRPGTPGQSTTAYRPIQEPKQPSDPVNGQGVQGRNVYAPPAPVVKTPPVQPLQGTTAFPPSSENQAYQGRSAVQPIPGRQDAATNYSAPGAVQPPLQGTSKYSIPSQPGPSAEYQQPRPQARPVAPVQGVQHPTGGANPAHPASAAPNVRPQTPSEGEKPTEGRRRRTQRYHDENS